MFSVCILTTTHHTPRPEILHGGGVRVDFSHTHSPLRRGSGRITHGRMADARKSTESFGF